MQLPRINGETVMKKAILALGLIALNAAASPAAGQESPGVDSGLYLSVRALGANPTAKDDPSQQVWELNYGYGGMAAIGYAVALPGYATNFRFEIEASYRMYEFDSITDPPLTLCGVRVCPTTGDFNIAAGMANVYFDFSTTSRIVPTLGFGYGRARYYFQDWAISGGPTIPNFHFDTDIFQVMGGIGYRLSPGLIIDAEYRYLQPNDSNFNGFFSNELTIGLRFIL